MRAVVITGHGGPEVLAVQAPRCSAPDLTPASASPRRPGPIVSITCGAAPIGRTIPS